MTEFRRIRLGMVGGGKAAFIGEVHRIAARMDDCYELIAGCLSPSPEKARESARELGVPRSYDDYSRMAREEAARDDGIEAIAIVKPNHLHHPVARAFFDAGKRSLVAYNYSGYPMARQEYEDNPFQCHMC